jgi:hypothetical protein
MVQVTKTTPHHQHGVLYNFIYIGRKNKKRYAPWLLRCAAAATAAVSNTALILSAAAAATGRSCLKCGPAITTAGPGSNSSGDCSIAEAGFQLTNEVLMGTAAPELCPIG